MSGRLSPQLDETIALLHKLPLQALVRDICMHVPGAQGYVEKKLFVPYDYSNGSEGIERASSDDEDEEEDEDEDEDNENAQLGRTRPAAALVPPPIAGTKRLRLRYALCENCDQQFDILTNTRTSCRYHPDPSEPDYDLFPDHDEDCHGIIDSHEMREEFPENFKHPCCGRNAAEEPCTVDFHRESDYARKYRR